MIIYYKKAMSAASNKLNQCVSHAYTVITQPVLLQYFVWIQVCVLESRQYSNKDEQLVIGMCLIEWSVVGIVCVCIPRLFFNQENWSVLQVPVWISSL